MSVSRKKMMSCKSLSLQRSKVGTMIKAHVPVGTRATTVYTTTLRYACRTHVKLRDKIWNGKPGFEARTHDLQ